MSPLVKSRHDLQVRMMSVLPPKQTLRPRKPMFCFVPIADIMCHAMFGCFEAAQSGLRLMASTMLRHLTMSDRNIVSAAF